jgi:hypothetical protein
MGSAGDQGVSELPAEGTLDPFDDLLSTLQAAIGDRAVAHRIAAAQTSVHLRVRDDGGAALTILLDREPPEVLEGTIGEAEVEIDLPASHLARLWDEDYHLAMAIAKGEVGYNGPVRKFLRVMPVLQRFSRELHGRVREDPEEWE